MSRSIEVIITPIGEVKIDAVGFKGVDCEKATAFLEAALGIEQIEFPLVPLAPSPAQAGPLQDRGERRARRRSAPQ
jgi:Protein of unknown function (DUF2997)